MWRQPNMMQQQQRMQQQQNMMQQQNMNPQQMQQRQRMMMHQQNMMQQNMMQQGMNPQQRQRMMMMQQQQQNMMQQQQQRNMMQQQQPNMAQQQQNMMQQRNNMQEEDTMQEQQGDTMPLQQQQDKMQQHNTQQPDNMQQQDNTQQREKMQSQELEEMMRLQEGKTQQGDTMQQENKMGQPQDLMQQKMGQQRPDGMGAQQQQMFSQAGNGDAFMGDKMGMRAPPPPPPDTEDAMAPNRGATQEGRSMEQDRSMEQRNQSPQRRSRSRSPRRRPRSRSRDRLRGGDRLQDRRRRSRSRDRTRRSRSRDRGRRPRDGERRDGDRKDGGERETREQEGRQQEREKRELERQRRDEGLPPLKANHLSICTRTLWLGKLTSQTTEGDLRKELEKFGEVDSIHLIPPRGCAYVCLSQRKDAARALNDLPGSSMIRLKAAWAPGTGMKESTFKSNWEVDKGVTYVPWDKLATISIDALAAGGMVDDESLPEHMKTAMAIKPMGIVPPHPKAASDMPPPVGMISVGGTIPGGPPPPPPREIPSQGPHRDNVDDRRPHGASDRQFPPQMDMPHHLMAGQPPPPRDHMANPGRPDNERWSSNDAERRLDGRRQGDVPDERRNRFLPPGMTPDLSMDAQRSFLMANPRGDTSRSRPGAEEWPQNEGDRREGAGREQDADDQRNYREYERSLAPGMNRSRFSGGEQDSVPFPGQQRPSRFGDTPEQQRPSRFSDTSQIESRSQNKGERMEGTDRRHGQDAGDQRSYGEFDRPPPGMNISRFSGGEQDSLPFPEQQRPSRFGDTPEQSRPSRFGDTSAQQRPSRFGDTPEQSRPSRFGDTPEQSRPSRFGDTSAQQKPSRFGDTPEQSRPSRFGDTPEQSKPTPEQRPSRFGDTPQQPRLSRFSDTPQSRLDNERRAPNQADRMAGADRSQMGYGDDRWNHKEGDQARQPASSFPEQYTTNTRGDDAKRQMNPEQWSAERGDNRAGPGQYQVDYAQEQRNYGDRSLPSAMDRSRPAMGEQQSFSRQQMTNPWSNSSKNQPDSDAWSSGKVEQQDAAGQYQEGYADDRRNYRDGRQEMPRMSHSGQPMPPSRGDTSESRPDPANRDRMDGTGQGEGADDRRYRRDDNRFQPPPSFSHQQMGNPRGDATRDRLDRSSDQLAGSGQRQAEYAGDRRNFGVVENPFRALMNKSQPQQRMPSSQLENEWQYPNTAEQRGDPGRYQGGYAESQLSQRGGDRFAREAAGGDTMDLEDASKQADVSRPPMRAEDASRPPPRMPQFPGAPGGMGPGPGFRGAPGQPFPAGQVPSLMSMPSGAPRTGGPPRSNDKDKSTRDRGDAKSNTGSSGGRDDSRARSSKEKQLEGKTDSNQRGRRDAPSWQR